MWAWAALYSLAGGGLETHALEHTTLVPDAPRTFKLGTRCP